MYYFSYCHVARMRKLFCINKKQTVIFIVVEDMIFWVKHWMFWIPKSCALNALRCQSHMGELFYYQLPDFHQVIWEGLQIFFTNFFWFTTRSFPIFKLLNSMAINTFKVIKKICAIHLVWLYRNWSSLW